MRMTRTALAAGLSAVALVGLPLTMAAPAAAQPIGAWDDPDPSGSPTPGETQAPATLTLQAFDEPTTDPEVIDALETDIPPADEDLDEVAVVVEDTTNEVAKPLDDRALDLTREAAPAADEQAAPTADVPEGPSADGDTGADENAGSDDATAGNADSAGDATDSSSSADGLVPEAAGSGTDSAGSAQTDAVAASSAAGVSSSSTGSLVQTGAASTGILQTGVVLLAGGILLVGVGRHRRTSSA